MKLVCVGCGGSGRVEKPRSYMSLEIGDGSTLSEWVPCSSCHETPGKLREWYPPA